jgi:serine/threonine-protein kinase
VYSLACVLYEMLAGDPPHVASTAQAVLAKILTEDAPPLTHRRRAVPAHVAAAVARALERLPADRFESAAAFAAALNDPAFRFVGPAAHRAGGGSVRGWDTRARVLAGVATVTSALAVAGFALALGGPEREADPGPPSVTVALESLAPASDSRIDVSALGGVAISLRFQGGIRYRPPDRDSAAVLPGTQGATAFGFSPDGQWLAFTRASAPLRAQTLYKLRLRDGETLPVHEGLGSSSLLWGEDGWIYLAAGGFAGARQILRIAEGGGAVDTLLTVSEVDPEDSRVEPVGAVPWRGGRAALLVGFRLAGEEERILALDPETGDTTTLVPRATGRAFWSPTGHLVYQDGRSVFAAPFDPPSGTLGGAEVLLTDVHDFALARGGLLAYLLETEPARGDVTFAFLGSDGFLEKLGLLPQTHGDASLSPDGRRVAYIGEGVAGPYGARIFDVVTGADRLAHREVTGGHFPVWSPDGRKVAVSGMSVVDLEGDSLRHDHSHVNPHQWISDNRILGTPRGGGISLLELDAERTDRPERDVEVLNTRWQELQPALSPDERWLAYLSNEPDSTDRVYLRRWDDLGGQVEASADGLAGRIQRGDRLLWSPDGGSLFYVRGGRIVRATLRLDARGAPAFDHAVVTARPPNATLRGQHPDGRFFLQVDEEPDRAPAPTVAALLRTNFFRELRETAGGGS